MLSSLNSINSVNSENILYIVNHSVTSISEFIETPMVICMKKKLWHTLQGISHWDDSPHFGSKRVLYEVLSIKRLQGRGDKGSCPDVITHLASLHQTGGGPAWLAHKLFGKHSLANISHHHHQYLSLSSSIFVTIIINICHHHHQYFLPSSSKFFTFILNIFHLDHQYLSQA